MPLPPVSSACEQTVAFRVKTEAVLHAVRAEPTATAARIGTLPRGAVVQASMLHEDKERDTSWVRIGWSTSMTGPDGSAWVLRRCAGQLYLAALTDGVEGCTDLQLPTLTTTSMDPQVVFSSKLAGTTKDAEMAMAGLAAAEEALTQYVKGQGSWGPRELAGAVRTVAAAMRVDPEQVFNELDAGRDVELGALLGDLQAAVRHAPWSDMLHSAVDLGFIGKMLQSSREPAGQRLGRRRGLHRAVVQVLLEIEDTVAPSMPTVYSAAVCAPTALNKEVLCPVIDSFIFPVIIIIGLCVTFACSWKKGEVH